MQLCFCNFRDGKRKHVSAPLAFRVIGVERRKFLAKLNKLCIHAGKISHVSRNACILVKEPAVFGYFHQRLVFMLTVHINQKRCEFSQISARNRNILYPGA